MASAGRIAWAKFRVTTLVVVALLILGTLLFELFGGDLLAAKANVYLYIPDASGLDSQSPVRVDGIDVGRVSSVELTRSRQAERAVKVTLALSTERLRTIPIDSVTQISSDSLVGDKFVDIASGTNPKTVPPGGELTYKDQPELLRSLDLSQFTQQLRLVDATLADIEEGRSQMGQFVKGDQFYNDLQKRLNELKGTFEAAVRPDTAVGGLLRSDALYKQISNAVEQVDQSIATIQSGQGTAGQLLRDSAQYDQLLATTQQLRKSIASVGASSLLQSDQAYTDFNQKLAGLLKTVDDLNQNPMLMTSALYDETNGSLKELQETIRDFRTNPKKYLRLKIF